MDDRLIRDFRGGDRKAFEGIFLTYSDRIIRFIASIVKSESDAEDLAQSIFVKLWENRETFNPTVSLNSYMYATARNAALNFIKSRKLHETIIQQTTEQGGHQLHATENRIKTDELIAIIDARVGAMSPQHGTIYRLSQQEAMSPTQIAGQLNLSEKTVRNQLVLIFKDLRAVADNYLSQ